MNKKTFIFIVIALVFSVAMLFPSSVFALQEQEPPGTPEQVILLGIIASAITFLLRVLFTYANVQLSRVTVNIVLFIVSFVCAIGFAGIILPPLPADVADVWRWLNDMVSIATPILGAASLIYNFLYSKVILPSERLLFKSM